MISEDIFDEVLPDCCKKVDNLVCVKKSIEYSRQYVWFKCKKCENIYLKTEKTEEKNKNVEVHL